MVVNFMMIKPFQTILITTRTGCIGTLVYGKKQVYPFLVICVAFRHLGNFRLVYNCNLTFFVFRCDFLRGSVGGQLGVSRGSADPGVSVLSKPNLPLNSEDSLYSSGVYS